MNNASTVALRVASRCLREPLRPQICSKWLRARTSSSLTYISPHSSYRKSSLPQTNPFLFCNRNERFFSNSARTSFRESFVSQKLKAYNNAKGYDAKDEEKGLQFRKSHLSEQEIHHIFGTVIPPPEFANYLLCVLHGRRVDGTLDLPLPAKVEAELKRYPYAVESALYWLRKECQVDEDAAIMARIEREESEHELENPADLQQRATDLGLYHAPQSGNFRAKSSEAEGDVYGISELDRIRAENIAEAEKEEEELQAEIDKLQTEIKVKQETKALAQRPEQGLESAQEIRPLNDLEKRIVRARMRAQSKLTLDSSEVAQTTLISRLLPSLLFVGFVCAGSYLLAQLWVPPKRSDRMFPGVSLSFATVGALLAANVAIYGAWSLPPFWRVLNRYFIATPAYPRALSMLGNVFSHQSGKHLLYNMAGLVIFGLSLHEDVGRGTFMALYLSCGVLGSFASLSRFAVQRMFVTSSLGASGSIWGIIGAWCWIHAKDDFSFVFLPADTFTFKGWMVLAIMTATQIVGYFSPIKKIDYASHVAGIVSGVVIGQWWKSNQRLYEASQTRQRKRALRWYDILLGRVPETER